MNSGWWSNHYTTARRVIPSNGQAAAHQSKPAAQAVKNTAGSSSVTVKQGDTLWLIANRNHITLSALIAANPNVTATNLIVGTKLKLPVHGIYYVVKPKDTLWLIAKQHHVTLAALTAANPHVQAADLMPGTSLVIPAN